MSTQPRTLSFTKLTIGAAALVLCLLFVFPGSSPVPQLLRLLGVWAIADYSYRRLCPSSRAGRLVILCAWTLLAIGVTLNVWYFTTRSGGTLTDPVLLNDDAAAAWRQMTATMAGTESEVGATRQGYGRFLALISAGGEATIDGMLDTNMLATLMAIVLTGAAAAAMTGFEDRRRRSLACTWAMALTASTSYFLMSGTVLIKDAMCCLAMAATLCALYGRLASGWRAGLLCAAAALAFMIRPALLPFMALAVLASLATTRRRDMAPAVLLALLMGALYVWKLKTGATATPADLSDGSTNFDLNPGGNSARLAAYSTVGGDYGNAGMLRQLLLLPFSLTVQYLTPLPGAFVRDTVFGPSEAWAHFAFPWYAIGGLLLFYLIFRYRRSPSACKAAFAFGIAAWVLTAIMTGGTVSRYCLPWLPFMVPGGAWLIVSGQWNCAAFRRWAVAYTVVLAIALVTVFIFMGIYSPGGWKAA